MTVNIDICISDTAEIFLMHTQLSDFEQTTI